jgi:hypothetical protein
MKITKAHINTLPLAAPDKRDLCDLIDEVEKRRDESFRLSERFLECLENYKQALNALEQEIHAEMDKLIAKEDSEVYDVDEL